MQKCASLGDEITRSLGVFTAELVNCLVEANKEGKRITNHSNQIANMTGDDCLEKFYFSD